MASARLQEFEPVKLDTEQAKALREQFLATANHRGWRLIAGAIMPNHVHLLVAATDEAAPEGIMRDLKAYSARRLNALAGTKRKWWTRRGSRRYLSDQRAVVSAAAYVQRQQHPLLVWAEGDRSDPPA